ncbi:leucine-rich repeat-containing protein, partial [Tanacetum coccineum]
MKQFQATTEEGSMKECGDDDISKRCCHKGMVEECCRLKARGVHGSVEFAGGATTTCIDNERQALLGFKARLLDPYDRLSTWRSEGEDDCCKWGGVTCDNQTGHVTMLDLSNYYIRVFGGEISLSLLNLTYLNYLDLSYCSFHGTIPPFIGSMTQLTYLVLSYNQFTGSIPKSIGSLTGLTLLNLRGNQLVGTIPMSIGYLTNLTTLYLDENNLSGIPESIGSLTSLTDLWLQSNNFSGIIPRSIGSLTKLNNLYLGHNSFHGTIPPEFGNLTNLLDLSLRYLPSCTIENLDWLSSLSSLSYLLMESTSLAKANNWVNVIIGLQNLKMLSLMGCDLSEVMHPYSSVVNSSSTIHSLYLNDNNLNSSSYRWLCPLVGNKVNYIRLSGNSFDGKIVGSTSHVSFEANFTP